MPSEVKEIAANLVAKNKAAFELLHQGATNLKCCYPVDMTCGSQTLIPHLPRLKAAAQLLALKATMEAEEDQVGEATRSIGDLFALGDSLEQEPMLISLLVRFSCHEIAVSVVESLLNRRPVKEDQELSNLEGILQHIQYEGALRRAWIGERCFDLDIFNLPSKKMRAFLADPQEFASGSARPDQTGETPFGYLGFWMMRISGHFDRDKLFCLETIDNYIRAIDSPPPARLEIAGRINALVGDNKIYRKGERWPFIISGLLLPPVAKVFNREAQRSARIRLARTGLALERYRLAHSGQLPSGISELIPAYLNEVPIDPFDGHPLRYKKLAHSFVVYSIGPDGRDDGGTERKALSDAQRIRGVREPPYDITFTVKR